jgi:DNA-3-methyladenine glycosylase II
MAITTTRTASPTVQGGDGRPSVVVRPRGPFDLPLSIEAAASFFPAAEPPPAILRTPVRVEGSAAIVEVSQSLLAPGLIHASSTPALQRDRLRAIVKWLISADLDLRPFYALVASHPVMGSVVLSLIGLKPLRPATLFEMAVIAITEQQLSLAAAFQIRARLVRRFGASLGDLWVFPSPERLAAASLQDLRACGLSRRKAEYVKGLARRIMNGALDLETLQRESDQQIRDALASNRGVGEWSVQYILGRGFGRPDCLPSGDIGLRRVVGHYVAGGRRLTAVELEQAVAPFKPFRGLAAFYLAVHWRLRRSARPRPMEPRELARASAVGRPAIGGARAARR